MNMNSDLERTLDDMEACLVAVGGLELVHRLAGPTECRIQIQDVSLDIDRKTAAWPSFCACVSTACRTGR